MKRILIPFLQLFIVLMGVVMATILIRFPLTEGRTANLDLFNIYLDPFILYGYVVSIPFFVTLYKAFKLLGYIKQNKLFSSNAVKTIKSIKYCAIIISILIVLAGFYIKLYHHKADDPAGFLVICILAAFASVAVATTAAIVENTLDKKSEMA